MSLQTELASWKNAYDNVGINDWTDGWKYIGSICATDGNFYTQGTLNPTNSMYETGTGNDYIIHPFYCYAGQGTHLNGGTSKFLVHSENGFSWDTIYNPSSGRYYDFESSGQIDTIYLGSTTETSESPTQANFNVFDSSQPLLVIDNFYVAANYVGNLIAVANGAASGDGNSSLDYNDTYGGVAVSSWLSNEQYYLSTTVNYAVLYGLTFNSSANITGSQNALEYVLDTYLKSISGGAVDITDDLLDIEDALLEAESTLTIESYYDEDGVIDICNCPETEAANDTLLAA